ncbi:hsp70-Hsp90 organizing protein-like [Thalassophryne amazonica]|uniref:hsp70-Hsp90 organizing protein-like n=1 Tax=Thalassophryne amazonica TaxID=390379 RepID=UPI0014710CFA|nr:hsp70-Hsp90 organizing protein-like [Thalassophryne amazonica]
MNVFASGLFGLDFLRNYDRFLENDYYSDSDDYFSDHHDHHLWRNFEPHPRIRQLTEEEAEKNAKELIEEEERSKEKSDRNRRKKMRQKERKRLEKENAAKSVLPEKHGKSDSLENEEDNILINTTSKANECALRQFGKTENVVPGGDIRSGTSKNGTLVCNKEEKQKDLNLEKLYASTTSVGAETLIHTPATERKQKKNKSLNVQQPRSENPKVLQKPELQKKEEKCSPIMEQPMDSNAEEFAIRSRELAGIGNWLAGTGHYETAVKCFTDAIKYNPKEFKLFGNRSLCYERMQQYENALRDADLALSVEPKWIKGLFRKGKALCGLQRYYEASLIYKEVLKLDSATTEATEELKRAQTLHLMEMGFTFEQSTEALKTHATLEEAIDSLFGVDDNPGPGTGRDTIDQPGMQLNGDNSEEGEWVVRQKKHSTVQRVRGSNSLGQIGSKSQLPTPVLRNTVKPDLFPVWVGFLAPAVTYGMLHELFSRTGTVYSIKMLLEHQCAFVNYTRKEDCDRAIQCLNGMVVEGAPLSVRYPNKIHFDLGASKLALTDPCIRPNMYKKECFFWRTTGCTRPDCTFRHIPEHKNIDKDKFIARSAFHYQ